MKELKCPVKRNRLQVLLNNAIIYLNTETMMDLDLDEKVNLLKEEIGFTDEEIKQLEIVENCLDELK